MKPLKPESTLVAAARPHGKGEPLNVPMVPASNFRLGAGNVYAREDSTPTWNALEQTVGELEGGAATAFSSGMAAAAAVFDQVPGGGQVVMPHDCYQGVASLAAEGVEKGRWTLKKIATDDTGGWVKAAESADLIWIESPSNPMLIVADLETICAVPRKAGGILAVDNTFATPLNQQPLKLGADISMHSATKYIGGHSDLLGGLVITADEALHAAMIKTRRIQGAAPGTMETWLATRGIRTMAVRLERAQENAQSLAGFLSDHPCVDVTIYPGLTSHPQHELASRQLGGFGGIISCVIKGDGDVATAVCEATQLIQHATSLGSVETTMERRAAHGGQSSLPDALLRISVGIEAFEDLRDDLDQALRSCCGTT